MGWGHRSTRHLVLNGLLVGIILLTTLLTPFSVSPVVAQEPNPTPVASPSPTEPPVPIPPEDLVAPPDQEPPPPVPDVPLFEAPPAPELPTLEGPAVFTPTAPLTVTLSATLPPQGYVNNFILGWQVEGLDELDPAPQDLRLELRFAEGATPDGRPHLYDPTTRTLRIEQGVAQGHVPVEVEATRTGPFSVEALLVVDETPRGGEDLFFAPPRPVGPAGGQVRGFEGRVRVNFPANVLPSAANVQVGRPTGERRPPHSLLGGAFEVVAFDAVTGAPQHQFDAPLTITVRYDEAQIEGAEEDLSLFYFDEEMGQWRPLPTRVDAEANELVAQTDHFTSFDFDLQNWQAARLPTMAEFQVSGFTGAATYSYPIQVPAGPGGLEPSLSLHYNSQVVDSASSRTQAGWAGMGWSLDVGSIQRVISDTNSFVGDDTFLLTVAGVSSPILPIPDPDPSDNYSEFRTQDESFYRIQCERWPYHPNDCLSWRVWDKAGTIYTFDNEATYVYFTGCVNTTDWMQVNWYWPLSTVQSVTGQTLTYTYWSVKAETTGWDARVVRTDKRPIAIPIAIAMVFTHQSTLDRVLCHRNEFE